MNSLCGIPNMRASVARFEVRVVMQFMEEKPHRIIQGARTVPETEMISVAENNSCLCTYLGTTCLSKSH